MPASFTPPSTVPSAGEELSSGIQSFPGKEYLRHGIYVFIVVVLGNMNDN
jgi:hypothetical protein